MKLYCICIFPGRKVKGVFSLKHYLSVCFFPDRTVLENIIHSYQDACLIVFVLIAHFMDSIAQEIRTFSLYETTYFQKIF